MLRAIQAAALGLLGCVGFAANGAWAQSAAPASAVSANGDDRLLHLAHEMAGGTGAAIAPETPLPSSSSSPLPSVSAAKTGEAAMPLGPRSTALRPMNALGGGASHDSESGGAAGSSTWVLNTLTALGAVIGVIFLVKAVHKKWAQRGGRILGGAGGGTPVVEVLGRTAIAPRNHLVLVRLGRRILVLGDSPNGLRTLAELDDADEVAGLVARLAPARADSISGGFNHLLGRFHSEYRESRRADDEGGDQHEHVVDRARDQLGSLLSRIRTGGKGGPA